MRLEVESDEHDWKQLRRTVPVIPSATTRSAETGSHLLRGWSSLAMVVILGCGQGSPAPPTPEVVVPTASVGARTDRDRLESILRCGVAGERAQGKLASAPEEAWAELVRGCADVYSAPACRAAWLESTSAPSDARFSGIERACVSAYCPLLPEPKPELCAAPAVEDSLAAAPKWQAFTRRVLAYELAVDEDQLPRGTAAPWSFIPLKLPDTAKAPAAVIASIQLAVDPKGGVRVRVDRDDHHGTFNLPAVPSAADFAPVVRSVLEPPGEIPRVAVRADRDVGHGVVIVLLDALKSAGVSKIAFGVSPAPTP